jgi:hypothetical protein
MRHSSVVLPVEPYRQQLQRWPASGRHILASYDEHSIVVYQAYAPDIADHAVAHQRFGGRFSVGRMSWIKPNFLWMMYRSGWAMKEGQERVLAVRLPRQFFDELLARAVPSSVVGGDPDVRLQWDPDHNPAGAPLERRALQLGLRGEPLRRYATSEIEEIVDVTAFAAEQRTKPFDQLLTPREDVYRPADPAVRSRMGLD